MNKNRQLKELKVAEIKEKLEKAQSVVLASYQGLTVEEDTILRKSLREAGVEYKVYKNSLVILAAKELGMDSIEEYLQGPVSIALGYEDATAPARVLFDFAKSHKKLELKAGIVDSVIYNKEQVEKLATIPSKEVLIAKLLGSFKAPLSKIACVLNAIKEKKETESAE
ncbi:50S ribosomal protein L10 [Clostridium gasigenes]|uniref:Large ribosomal subunit protein uL10 n=1 Tax=Clostridium gasigenes TaxID=94869 RepID=A0A1H0SHH1_9CLOT|nr:50S ribosomal protein L10 [Clostridium gasigenes]MBB6625012.1 50S ribosomal protein L10 [Clostridium gasigenes]MBB6715475.1 50S ribosomal protein L10 [Clostridium gasigenes]MBU3088964.1 50S ribosomal protein L10 [Clostridium gasigenes]MBU3104877.1 50S ribosomal protein L10 [Clostridium gasigenes]MBU3108669.1 50S ribosomal protein L10 [Clostridium gasigenes]